MILICYLFFFFKQKTAYEIRISDWSSDVCSSDLADLALRLIEAHTVDLEDHHLEVVLFEGLPLPLGQRLGDGFDAAARHQDPTAAVQDRVMRQVALDLCSRPLVDARLGIDALREESFADRLLAGLGRLLEIGRAHV